MVVITNNLHFSFISWFPLLCSLPELKMYTDSQKHESTLVHTYWTNFWQPIVHVQPKLFEKTLIEIGSPHLYPSFGTFCAQIGQLFEAQWVFEICLKINKSLSSKENVVDFAILPIVYRFTLPRKIDQFGHKRCQKKRKDVDYKLL